MSKVKVGILGAGFIAKVHIGNLKNDERVEIAGVVDLDLDKAKTLAKEAGPQANAFTSLDELFTSEVDAVYVTTPNTRHVGPVLKCLENNVNVFCEKPMATSLREAEQIKDASAKSKGILQPRNEYEVWLRLQESQAADRLRRGEALYGQRKAQSW